MFHVLVTSSLPSERTFVTRDWYQKYQDNVTPIGLAFYQCDWDTSVKDFFHSKLQTKEPGEYLNTSLHPGLHKVVVEFCGQKH